MECQRATLDAAVRHICQHLFDQGHNGGDIVILGESAMYLHHYTESFKSVSAWTPGFMKSPANEWSFTYKNLPIHITHDIASILGDAYLDLELVSQPYNIIQIEGVAFYIQFVKPESLLFSYLNMMKAQGYEIGDDQFNCAAQLISKVPLSLLGAFISSCSRQFDIPIGELIDELIYIRLNGKFEQPFVSYSNELFNSITHLKPQDAAYIKNALAGGPIVDIESKVMVYLDPNLETEEEVYGFGDTWMMDVNDYDDKSPHHDMKISEDSFGG